MHGGPLVPELSSPAHCRSERVCSFPLPGVELSSYGLLTINSPLACTRGPGQVAEKQDSSAGPPSLSECPTSATQAMGTILMILAGALLLCGGDFNRKSLKVSQRGRTAHCGLDPEQADTIIGGLVSGSGLLKPLLLDPLQSQQGRNPSSCTARGYWLTGTVPAEGRDQVLSPLRVLQ